MVEVNDPKVRLSEIHQWYFLPILVSVLYEEVIIE